LTNIETLILNNNSLTTLYTNLFDNLPRLKNVYLLLNPFSYDNAFLLVTKYINIIFHFDFTGILKHF